MSYWDTSYPPSLWAPPPPPPPDPSLASIAPATGVTGTAATITCTGANFTASSVIKFGATSLVTTFVDSGHISGAITLPAAGPYQVTVATGEKTTAAQSFTVNPVAEEPEATDDE